MYWQFFPVRQNDTWPNGGNYRLDLPQSGLLSSIFIHAKRAGITDSMNATQKWRLMDWISNLKVIGNGSEVIKDVTGQIAHFLQWADGGPLLTGQHFNYGSSTKRFICWLNMGRRPYDDMFGLDLAQWQNVELVFTNDGSSTYFAGDWAIDIFLLLMRDPPTARPFSQYIMSKVWRQITTIADHEDYLHLPTVDKLRRCIVQVVPAVDANVVAKTQGYNVLENIKFTLQGGKETVFDSGLRELWYLNQMNNGRLVAAGGEPYHTSGKGVWTGLGQTWYKTGLAMPQGGAGTQEAPAVEPGGDNATQTNLRTVTDNFSAMFFGTSLENCNPIPFAHVDEPEHWLDLNAQREVDLQLTTANSANAADGIYRVVLETAKNNG